MSAGEISNAAYDRIGGVFNRALTGLSIEQLKAQPSGPEGNPIGWTAWHLTRTQDRNYSQLLGTEEAWVADGWHERFGLAPDRGTGNGDSLEQVRGFDPVDAETLMAYFVGRARKVPRIPRGGKGRGPGEAERGGRSTERNHQDLHRPRNRRPHPAHRTDRLRPRFGGQAWVVRRLRSVTIS